MFWLSFPTYWCVYPILKFHGSLPLSRSSLHTIHGQWSYGPQHDPIRAPLTPGETRCHGEVPVALPHAWSYHHSYALSSSLALDEPSWSSVFNAALERGFHALKPPKNHCFTSIMISMSAPLNFIAVYYEFNSGKGSMALSPFSLHLRGIWTPVPSSSWFGYAEASLALHQINLLLIQSAKIASAYYFYKQRLKNSITETSQGVAQA